tara:strand:- start:32561 stop:32980 length:420 start_codon:yes stop_codon:yes gene_type:complete
MPLFTVILLFTSITFAQNLVPGIWKATVRVKLLGIPLPTNEQKECVRPKDIKNIKTVVSEALEKNGCKLKEWKLKKQKLDAQIQCKTEDLDAAGKLTGTIKEKSYDLAGTAEGYYQSKIPTKAEISLKGEWLGFCSEKY